MQAQDRKEGKGAKQSSKGNDPSGAYSQSGRIQQQQPGSVQASNPSEYQKKPQGSGNSNHPKDDSKKIKGYVPDVTQFKQFGGGSKKSKKDKNQPQEPYERDFDQESEIYSQSKSNYVSEYYSSTKEKSQLVSGQDSNLYANDKQYDRESQRSKKVKDGQLSMSSKNKFDSREMDSRQQYLESSEYHSYMGSHKGEKGSVYSQKSGHYMEEDPKMMQSYHPYAYTQQPSYTKNDSGSKKDSKSTKDPNNLYMNQKGQYPQGRKGKPEMSGVPMGAHQAGYYHPPYGNPANYQMVPGHKYPHKAYMQSQSDFGREELSEDMNFDYADISHQEKIKQLMRINGEQTLFAELSQRAQGGLVYPPSGEFLHG